MKKIILVLLAVVIVVLSHGDDVFAGPMNIDRNTKINTSVYEGIKVNKSCKIVFNNTQDIIIGDMYNNTTPGIEVIPGITLTIQLKGCGNVNVYGGFCVDSGNRYSYAGIYVPVSSKLVIDGNDACVLSVVGHLGAAGIGGCGVAMNSRDVDYGMINAGSIYIKGGNVVTTSACHDECLHRGTGAGIGGGGVFNAIERDSLIGGSVELVEIHDGRVTAIGGGSSTCSGVGAGIGGGGVCNVVDEIFHIKGGSLKKVKLEKGVITARGGSNNNVKGLGAGIGGGGIFNEGRCDKIQEGQLIELLDYKDVKLNLAGGYKYSVDMGSGSINYNDICIKGVEPVENLINESLSVGDILNRSNKKFLASLIMTIIGFLVMLGK